MHGGPEQTPRCVLRIGASLSLLAVGCGMSTETPGTPPPANGPAPVIRRFVAAPNILPEGGGSVTLSWDVDGAAALTLEPEQAPLTPVTTGSIVEQVTGSTAFVLHATSSAGQSTLGIANVAVPVVCTASGAVSGACDFFLQGRCLDYSNVSELDASSLLEACTAFAGSWSLAPCPSEHRLGTCDIPWYVQSTGLDCSPDATVLERFYSPTFNETSAASVCESFPGSTYISG